MSTFFKGSVADAVLAVRLGSDERINPRSGRIGNHAGYLARYFNGGYGSRVDREIGGRIHKHACATQQTKQTSKQTNLIKSNE